MEAVRQSVSGTYVSDVTGGAGEDEDHGGEAAGQAHATDLLTHRHYRFLGLVEARVHVRIANVLCIRECQCICKQYRG